MTRARGGTACAHHQRRDTEIVDIIDITLGLGVAEQLTKGSQVADPRVEMQGALHGEEVTR